MTLRHLRFALILYLFFHSSVSTSHFAWEACVSQRRISDPELTKLWRLHRSTLATWHTEGVLTSDGRAQRTDIKGGRTLHWYHVSTITKLHRNGLRNKSATLPSVSALMSQQAKTGQPSLLTTVEVAERLDMLHDSVMAEIYA